LVTSCSFQHEHMGNQLDLKGCSPKKTVEGPLLKKDYCTKLKDIIDGENWEFDKIFLNIPDDTKENIIKVRICLKGEIRDIPIWSLTTKEFLTTKTCYNLIEPPKNNLVNFKWVRNLDCPNKVKFFI